MKTKTTIFICLAVALFTACQKLDIKPRQSLVVPETLQDLQGLLDHTASINSNYPTLGEISSDNYYLTQAIYNGLSVVQHKNAYIWYKNTFEGTTIEPDWDSSYERVFYSNVVLDGLDKLDPSQSAVEYNNVKGQALFHRAIAFWGLAQVFCKPYDKTTAPANLGIPLRLSSDLNVPSTRSTLQQTYDQIINDLINAKSMLPNLALYKTRPSKAVVFGLLSRIMLAKEDYQNAFLYADSCLQLNSTLLNYNMLSSTATYPFAQLNNEVLFHSTLTNIAILLQSRANIDLALYQSYSTNDLRKTLFFNTVSANVYSFKGSYYGAGNPLFGGIGTDEIYLNRAEANARLGRTASALADLNALMVTRFKTGTFTPFTASTADEALDKILIERRKELLLRGLRWTDLRRLNKDSRFATTLARTLGTDTYTLLPNDAKYTFPIPDYVIALSSGIQQNP